MTNSYDRNREFKELKELFEATGYKVAKKPKMLVHDYGKCWTVTHVESGDKMGLYCTTEWSVEPLRYGQEHSENFPEDVYEFADCNDIELE